LIPLKPLRNADLELRNDKLHFFQSEIRNPNSAISSSWSNDFALLGTHAINVSSFVRARFR
jgi:hypothetical protein